MANKEIQHDRSLFSLIVVTGFGSGYSPFAPGTAGSIVGVLIYLIAGVENPLVLCTLILVTFVAGVFFSGKVAGKDNPDPGIIVIDEIVGMWIALFLLPKTVWVILTAFLLFRILDIIKPFPARQSEKLPGGWGIMIDDVVAGIYANIIVHGVLLLS